MRIRQVTLLLICLGMTVATAQEEDDKAFEFLPPVVEVSFFGEQVKMLTEERDGYASNLANLAANLVIERKGSVASLDTAKRMLTVALHLAPRNRSARVTGFQLKEGVLPQKRTADYTSSVLSRLLLSRARLLAEDTDAKGKLLARCFVEIAATIDPRNEDAVYEFEIQRLDHGDIDWEALYDSPKKNAE